MYALVGFCIQFFLLSSLLCDKLVLSEEVSHYKPCPEGYDITFNSKCYKIGPRTKSKDVPCPLSRIDSQEENDFVKGLMNERGENSLWIERHRYDSPYQNYRAGTYGNCVYMETTGKWAVLYSCSSRRRSLCSVLRPCEGTWLGRECNAKCHCYKRNCSRELRACYTGCDPGWRGTYCEQEIQKPIVENYCFKNRTHYSMVLVMNLQSNYESLVPIDSRGKVTNPSNFPAKYNGRSEDNHFILELSTEDLSSTFKPNYFQKQIDETTFYWSFRLQEVNDVVSFNDYDFRVQCNFSEVDVIESSVTLDLKKDVDRGQYSLSPSDITAKLFFTDPFEFGPLENISLGQPVKLALTQEAINVSVKPSVFLTPRKCFAIGKDKLVVKQLSDANGCPIHDKLFKPFHLDRDDHLVTFTLKSFGMPGDSSFEILCSLVACYEKRKKCYKNCLNPMNSRNARSVMDIREPVVMQVSSTINIR